MVTNQPIFLAQTHLLSAFQAIPDIRYVGLGVDDSTVATAKQSLPAIVVEFAGMRFIPNTKHVQSYEVQQKWQVILFSNSSHKQNKQVAYDQLAALLDEVFSAVALLKESVGLSYLYLNTMHPPQFENTFVSVKMEIDNTYYINRDYAR